MNADPVHIASGIFLLFIHSKNLRLMAELLKTQYHFSPLILLMKVYLELKNIFVLVACNT